MARVLFAADHTAGAPGAATLVLVILVVLVVAAVVVSLCTSSTHEKLWGQQQRGSSSSAPLAKADSSVGASNRKHLLSATLSGIGGKAARMVSWNRRSPSGSSDDDDEEAVAALGPEDDEAVWRKAIIMGDKCRPLQFSGHIAFDSDGNQLPPTPPAVKKAAPDVPAEN